MFINVFVISAEDELEMYEDCLLELYASHSDRTGTWSLTCEKATYENDNGDDVAIATGPINLRLASVRAKLPRETQQAFIELASKAMGDATLEPARRSN